MSGRPARDDTGAVTAELAIALPAVVLVVAVVLVTAVAGIGQLRCADAARIAARVAALGEADAEVRAAARHVAGPGAQVRIEREPPWVEVVVETDGPAARFTAGALHLSATATAWAEP